MNTVNNHKNIPPGSSGLEDRGMAANDLLLRKRGNNAKDDLRASISTSSNQTTAWVCSTQENRWTRPTGQLSQHMAGQHPNDPEPGCLQEPKSCQDKLKQGAVGCHCCRKAGCIPRHVLPKKRQLLNSRTQTEDSSKRTRWGCLPVPLSPICQREQCGTSQAGNGFPWAKSTLLPILRLQESTHKGVYRMGWITREMPKAPLGINVGESIIGEDRATHDAGWNISTRTGISDTRSYWWMAAREKSRCKTETDLSCIDSRKWILVFSSDPPEFKWQTGDPEQYRHAESKFDAENKRSTWAVPKKHSLSLEVKSKHN